MEKIKKLVIWKNPGYEATKIAPRIDSDIHWENGKVERRSSITKEETLKLIEHLPFEELD